MALRNDRGRAAEELAAAHVLALGMRVIERNLRVGRLEIDIVAVDGDAVAVVEVRTRAASAWQGAADSIGWVKQERLRKAAALLWARRFSKWEGIERVRFDVAAVDLDSAPPRVEYFRAAFI